MAQEKYDLEDIYDQLGNIADAINEPKRNDFGYTLSDELHEMNFYLKQIMEHLETIANKK